MSFFHSDEPAPVLSYERLNSADERWPLFNFGEIWQYREMLRYLTLRDIKARYKQTVLGLLWTVINPFVTMIVFTFVFGSLAAVPSYNIPYPIFSFAALVPWAFFSRGLAIIPSSLVGNGALLSRVYFPRVLLPVSALLTCFIDFAVTFIMLLVMMLIFGMFPLPRALFWVPCLTLLAAVAAMGIGLWLAALNVQIRDIGYFVPFILQVLQFLSPIGYSGNLVQEPWHTLYALNPLAAVCDGFRWALLGTDTFQLPTLLISTASALLLLITGYIFFRRAEPNFSDLI